MSKFNPRAIPLRDHYDRVMTWTTGVFGRMDGDMLADIQEELHERARKLATDPSADDFDKIAAALAELGFVSAVDNMVDIIEQHEGNNA